MTSHMTPHQTHPQTHPIISSCDEPSSSASQKRKALAALSIGNNKSESGWQKLMTAFQTRIHQIVSVMDDAFRSDVLKDRIWAAEQMIKQLGKEEEAARKKLETLQQQMAHNPTKNSKTKNINELRSLSDEALLQKIRALMSGEIRSEGNGEK